MCSKIILARKKEESVTRQQSPITQKNYSTLLDQASKSPANSLETAIADWFALIKITGMYCAEYAQKNRHQSTSTNTPLGNVLLRPSFQVIGNSIIAKEG
jgi:hypothetical protein